MTIYYIHTHTHTHIVESVELNDINTWYYRVADSLQSWSRVPSRTLTQKLTENKQTNKKHLLEI